jgi:hypothetical protein
MSPNGGGVHALFVAVGAAVAGAAIGVVLVLGGGVDVIGGTEARLSSALGGVPVAECPGGAEADRFAAGDRVFATGRNVDRTWVEVRDHSGSPGWIRVEQLEPEEGSFDLLPVRECLEPVVETAAPGSTTITTSATTTTVPATTTTAATTTTTTAATTTTSSTSTTTTTTEPPDTTAPILTGPLVEPDRVYPDGCSLPNLPDEASAYLSAHDESGIGTVTLQWRLTGDYAGQGNGSFDVSVDPASDGYQLIGHIVGMPDPWAGSVISGVMTAPVEITWTVSDPAGNIRTFIDTFELGRCT